MCDLLLQVKLAPGVIVIHHSWRASGKPRQTPKPKKWKKVRLLELYENKKIVYFFVKPARFEFSNQSFHKSCRGSCFESAEIKIQRKKEKKKGWGGKERNEKELKGLMNFKKKLVLTCPFTLPTFPCASVTLI